MGDVMGLAEKIREMADTGGAEKIAESIEKEEVPLGGAFFSSSNR